MMNFQDEKQWWFLRVRKINYWWMFSRLRLCLFFSFSFIQKLKSWRYLDIDSLQGVSDQKHSAERSTISVTYQRGSPHVLTTSSPPDTLTLLSSHPDLSHFPLHSNWARRISCGARRKIYSRDKIYYSPPNLEIKQLPGCIGGLYVARVAFDLQATVFGFYLWSHCTISPCVNATLNHD